MSKSETNITIKDKTEIEQVPLEDLNLFDPFMFGKNLYFKLVTLDDSEKKTNALLIRTKEEVWIEPTKEVRPVNITIYITK